MMNHLKRYALFSAGVCALSVVFGSASADRPDCGADPGKPGACFEAALPGDAFIGCGFPDSEGLLVFLGAGAGANDFVRTNLDGTRYVHASVQEVAGVYCTWDTVITENCVPGSDQPFVGTLSLSANGVVDEFGNALCPFSLHSRGELFRVGDGEPFRSTGR